MNNNMYLIHEEDYIRHIDEKARLYSFVKQLAHIAKGLKPGRGNDELIKMAGHFGDAADELFDSWGIPKSYLVHGRKEALADLMENELIAPEDAGYFPCDAGDCPCEDNGCPYDHDCPCDDCSYDDCYSCEDDCPCDFAYCCEADDLESDVDGDFAETITELSSLIHKVFGNNVTVRIVLE